MQGKIIIITAPSGSGKTTLVKRLLDACPKLSFSISACTRSPRMGEKDGKDYYFISEEAFTQTIKEEGFVEWEMVYTGKYYGTLLSEMQRIWQHKQCPLVDIDVKGALAIQEKYPASTLSIFIQAPSVEELRRRLEMRGTETPQSLEERISKAAYELSFAPRFNALVVNDNLDEATLELVHLVSTFLDNH